jgi:subtilisin family serine protease
MNMKGTDSRADDQITSYSSKGPTHMDLVVKPDVVAPGNTIVSLLAPQSRLEQMFPDNRVDPLNPSGPFFDTGNQYFRLSGTSMAVPVVSGIVALMLNSADIASLPSLSPKVTYDPASGTAHLISDSSAVWGSSAVWVRGVGRPRISTGSRRHHGPFRSFRGMGIIGRLGFVRRLGRLGGVGFVSRVGLEHPRRRRKVSRS